MSKNTLEIIVIIFIFIFALIAINEPWIYYRNISINVLQAITVTLIFATVILAGKQIDETKKIEQDKRITALQSLIEELKYNQAVVKNYIQHTKEGANVFK